MPEPLLINIGFCDNSFPVPGWSQNPIMPVARTYLKLSNIFHSGLSRSTMGMTDLEHAGKSAVGQLLENTILGKV